MASGQLASRQLVSSLSSLWHAALREPAVLAALALTLAAGFWYVRSHSSPTLVPDHPDVLAIREYRTPPHGTPVFVRTITAHNQRRIAALATSLNSLPRVSGPSSCDLYPPGRHYVLQFQYTDGTRHTVLLDSGGCRLAFARGVGSAAANQTVLDDVRGITSPS